METYKAINDFMEACKCKIDCKIIKESMIEEDVGKELLVKFPGKNKVKWDLQQ